MNNNIAMVPSKLKILGATREGTFSVTYKSLNHADAKAYCKSYCTENRLADVESAAEYQRALDNFICQGFQQAWIGMFYDGSKWIWPQDGRTAWTGSQWNSWHPNDPNYDGNCVRVLNINGIAADHKCSNNYPAMICEGDFPDPCNPNPCVDGTCCVIDFKAYCACATGRTGPKCENIVSCPVNPPNFGVEQSYTSTSVNSVINQICKTGFTTVSGDFTHTCLADESWSGELLVCKEVSCQITNPTKGVLLTYQNVTYQSILNQQCDVGYQTDSGDPSRTCLHTGEWSGADLICRELQCPSPPNITNCEPLYISSVAYVHNTKVLYQCKHGFEHTGGDLERTCGSGGTWLGIDVICSAVRCNTPPSVQYTNSTHTGTVYGSSINYTCETGYILKSGNLQRYCQGNKEWSGPLPVCEEILCPEPTPQTGVLLTLSNNSTSYMAILNQQCDTGFQQMSGNAMRTCLENGTWSGEQLICSVVECTIPPNITNCDPMFVHSPYIYKSEVIYRCSHGYYHTGGDLKKTCGPNHTWQGIDPICPAVTCESLPLVKHSTFTQTGTVYNSTVTYTCKYGYHRTSGNVERQCQANKKWSGESPICEEIVCQDPTPKMGISIKYNSTSYSANATVQCDEGYEEVSGTNTITCLVNGSWSDTGVTCKVKSCPIPGHVPHTTVTQLGDSYVYMSVLMFKCKDGYMHTSGELTVVCLANGQWSGKFPSCNVSTCPILPHNDGITSTYNGTTVNSTLDQQCRQGYKNVSGDFQRTCLNNGEWSGFQLVCEDGGCKQPPPSVPHTNWIWKKTFRNESAEYNCKYGYRLISESQTPTKWCLSNQTWQGDDPICSLQLDIFEIYVPSKSETTGALKAFLKNYLGWLEVDFTNPNKSIGSVLGIVYVSFTIFLFVCLDCAKLANNSRNRRIHALSNEVK